MGFRIQKDFGRFFFPSGNFSKEVSEVHPRIEVSAVFETDRTFHFFYRFGPVSRKRGTVRGKGRRGGVFGKFQNHSRSRSAKTEETVAVGVPHFRQSFVGGVFPVRPFFRTVGYPPFPSGADGGVCVRDEFLHYRKTAMNGDSMAHGREFGTRLPTGVPSR